MAVYSLNTREKKETVEVCVTRYPLNNSRVLLLGKKFFTFVRIKGLKLYVLQSMGTHEGCCVMVTQNKADDEEDDIMIKENN